MLPYRYITITVPHFNSKACYVILLEKLNNQQGSAAISDYVSNLKHCGNSSLSLNKNNTNNKPNSTPKSAKNPKLPIITKSSIPSKAPKHQKTANSTKTPKSPKPSNKPKSTQTDAKKTTNKKIKRKQTFTPQQITNYRIMALQNNITKGYSKPELNYKTLTELLSISNKSTD